MIEKMYALFFGKSMSANVDKDTLIEDCVIHEKQLNKIKPVWVTDRDPFENVRKVLKSYENLITKKGEVYFETAVMPFDKVIANALKKDLKNWDEGAG